jgi:hypothetical protein
VRPPHPHVHADFGWLEEGPKIDTGKFPIPNGLRFLMTNGRLWDEFCDLCWCLSLKTSPRLFGSS